MLEVDFHSHSLFSQCGLHTIIEMLERARQLGLKALAITDHGPAQQGRLTSTFFDRLTDPVPGIRLLKGAECNFVDLDGEIDFPMKYLSYTDIVLLGIHPNTPKGLGLAVYTQLMLKGLRKNPFVDIITHPNDATFGYEFAPVARYAASQGMAMELNNSKILHNRITEAVTMEMLCACREAHCRIALCSDAHAIGEIGLDDSVRPLLDKVGYPRELVVTRDAEAAFAFVEERRKIKKDYCSSGNVK